MYKSGALSPQEFWDQQDSLAETARSTVELYPTFELTDWAGARVLVSWPAGGTDGPRELLFGQLNDPENVRLICTGGDSLLLLRTLIGSYRGDLFIRERGDEPTIEVAGEAPLDVEGTSVTFAIFRAGARCWAHGRASGQNIIVERSYSSLTATKLRRVTTIDRYLEGRVELLQTLRGER